MLALVFGVSFLLFTLWELRKGQADLLSWLGHLGLEVSRRENGCFFWLAIILQLVVSLGFVAWGVFMLRR
jgi:hypothetical protein